MLFKRVLVCVTLALPATSLWAGTVTSGRAYLDLCVRRAVRTGAPDPLSASDAAVREVRGVVVGLVTAPAAEGRPAGFTLLIKEDLGGGTLSLSGTGDVPTVSPEVRVRALVQAAPAVNSNKLNESLLGFATEVDVLQALQAGASGSARHGAGSTRIAAERVRAQSSRSLGLQIRPELTPPEQMIASLDPGVFAAYRRAVHYFNRRLTDQQLDVITATLLSYSLKYGVDARLVMSVVVCESDFKLGETSNAGAMGLGQLMPDTARSMGVSNPYDPIQNLEASIRLLKSHLAKHSDKDWWQELQLALADYNAGPGAVQKYHGVPPYHETRNYIVKVARWYQYFLTGR